MERAYKYRIYPTKEQELLIKKTIGCARYVYNYYLSKRKEAFEIFGTNMSYDQCSQDMTLLKRELIWLKEPDKFSLQNSLKDLNLAYSNYYRERKKGNTNRGYPNYKSKRDSRQSYRTNFTNDNIEIKDNMIKLPKLGWIRFKDDRAIGGRIINVTISRTPTDKYYASVCCEAGEIEKLPQNNNIIGIDLGLKDLAKISNGDTITNPKTLNKAEKKLIRLQRELSRKKKGSSNREKARHRLAVQHEKVANIRNDFLQKESTRLINENQVIILEDLKVKNMQKNRRLAKAISDASWGRLSSILEYKGLWYGRTVHKISTFFPSTQLCNVCGYQNAELKDLSIREWTCPSCNTKNHRDLNASMNIRQQGMYELGLLK